MNDYDALNERFYKDLEFYEAYYEELLEQYPEQWIAILGQKVVASSHDEFDLVDQLKTGGPPPGGEVELIRHMNGNPEILIVPLL